jgi:hypothetical protein
MRHPVRVVKRDWQRDRVARESDVHSDGLAVPLDNSDPLAV